MGIADLLKRFEFEAAVLGRLNHPGIARIYEAGVFLDDSTGHERPFLAMEYIKGQALHEFAQESNLGTTERLNLLVQICDAVHHAHQRGVIHRDLKPGNVIVKSDGQPSILDFGVARATEVDPELSTLQTRAGQLIGTVPYMSPEQVAGNSLDVDTRSDVYSLGVMAYQLLTGKMPYEIDETDYLQTVRAISEQQPTSLTSTRRDYRGDLDTIVLKSLEKDPDHRYQSASDFADDIRRYLNDQPIEARRTGWLERSWRWCRRNRAVATLAAAVMALTLSVAIISTVSAVRLKTAQTRITAENHVANKRLFTSYIDQAKFRRLSNRPGQRVESLHALTDASKLFGTLDWRPEEEAANLMQLRNDTIDSLSLLLDLEEVKSWPRPSWAHSIKFDTNYQRYAICDLEGRIQLRDVTDNRLIHELEGSGATGWALQFSPGGLYFAAYFHAKPKRYFRVWDIKTGELVLHDEVNKFFAFSSDGRKLANYRAGKVQLYSLDKVSDPPITFKSKFQPRRLFFRPDGLELAVCASNQTQIELWNIKSKSSHLVDVKKGVYSIDWTRDSKVIAAGCNDGVIRIWSVDQYQNDPIVLTGHTAETVNVSFNETGELLVSEAWDGTQRIWDVRNAAELFRPDHSHYIPRNRFGTRKNLLGFERGDRLGIGQFGPDEAIDYLPIGAKAHDANFHPTIPLVACATQKGVLLWDTVAKTTVAEMPIGSTHSIKFAPDGTKLYSSGKGGVREWPLEFDSAESNQVRIGTPKVLLKPENLMERIGWTKRKNTPVMERLSLDRSGRWLSIVNRKSMAVVMDLHEGNRLQVISGTTATEYQSKIEHASISPDGKWVVTCPWHGNDVWVWNAHTGDLVTKIIEAEDMSAVPEFSSDGKSLAVATNDELTIWNVENWEILARHQREHRWISPVAYSPDGRYLVTSDNRDSLQIRDAQSGDVLAILRIRGQDAFTRAYFSSDSSKLVATSRLGSVMTWDISAIRERLQSMGIDWE